MGHIKRILKFSQFCEGRTHVHYFDHEGAKGHVEDNQDGSSVLVSGIETKPEHRGKGHAHELMKKITHHLDKRGQTSHLHPLAIDDHVDHDRLRDFYRKHGYEDDPTHKSRMIRKPKD